MSETPPPAHARVASGIAGFDAILRGGLPSGGLYLVLGPPGSGKTILANQLCYHQVRGGRRILYITLLGESHAQMFRHLSEFSFFAREAIPDRVTYVSAYQALENDGIGGLMRLLQDEILRFRPDLLVIDGLAVAGELAESAVAFKKFVHELAQFTGASGCTTLLLTSLGGSEPRSEHTLVDGIIALGMSASGMRTYRQLEVRKMRGSDHLQGWHRFRIGPAGIEVFPRLESLVNPVSEGAFNPQKVPFGLPRLDRLIGGGLTSGTCTALLGTAGTGKSLFGLHFLAAGVRAGEPSLYFGMYEQPQRLLAKSLRLGFGLEQGLERGVFHLAWHAPHETYVDELAERLLDEVRRRRIRRLFLDGIDGFISGGDVGDRRDRFFAALTNELRLLDVTTIMTEETKIFPTQVQDGVSDLSAATENLLFLRQVEVGSRLLRLLAVVKLRDGGIDPVLHEFAITGRGVVVRGRFGGAEDLLAGTQLSPVRGRARATAAKSRPMRKRAGRR
jgi:circadian clock protein KaiC